LGDANRGLGSVPRQHEKGETADSLRATLSSFPPHARCGSCPRRFCPFPRPAGWLPSPRSHPPGQCDGQGHLGQNQLGLEGHGRCSSSSASDTMWMSNPAPSLTRRRGTDRPSICFHHATCDRPTMMCPTLCERAKSRIPSTDPRRAAAPPPRPVRAPSRCWPAGAAGPPHRCARETRWGFHEHHEPVGVVTPGQPRSPAQQHGRTGWIGRHARHHAAVGGGCSLARLSQWRAGEAAAFHALGDLAQGQLAQVVRFSSVKKCSSAHGTLSAA